MNHLKKHLFCFLLFLSLLFALSACRISGNRPQTLTSFALDTVVSVTYYRPADRKAAENALALCSEYEIIFSRTDESSELYRLNESIRTADPDEASCQIRISETLYNILAACREYAEASGEEKAFDCTLGALSSAYNFSGEEHRVPAPEETAELLSHSGMDKWSLKAPDCFISYDPELTLDLGAVAKGWIADRMKESMVNAGVTSGIINLGGNILLLGSKPDGSDYEIGIADPENTASSLTTLKLSDCAVVTSGTYQRSFTLDGKVYHHILDPATGCPVENDLYSVTVIAADSTDADALSTALFVLGEKKGEALAERFSPDKVIYVGKDRTIR